MSYYKSILYYIIHLRNPFDILISQYYSFGYDFFIKRRKIIHSQTIDQYCLSQENIDDINYKYNRVLNWVEKYKHKENVLKAQKGKQ